MNKLFSMNVFFISLLISLLGSNEILKNNISENKIEKKISSGSLFRIKSVD